MEGRTITLTLKIWRQSGPEAKGRFETYEARDISTDMSFLEMLDIVNADLERTGQEPIAFEHDCREGICGTCGAVVDGRPHGPQSRTTLCQLHMRHFHNNQVVVIEPFRAAGFPILKDLIVDRSAFDRILQAGGYVSVRTGAAPEAATIPVTKGAAEAAMDAAECIGCGACVAACPNASASLFTAAKIAHLGHLPQGHPERRRRVLGLVQQLDRENFGACSKHYECQAVCPKGVKVENIAFMNVEYLKALVMGDE